MLLEEQTALSTSYGNVFVITGDDKILAVYKIRTGKQKTGTMPSRSMNGLSFFKGDLIVSFLPVLNQSISQSEICA